MKAFNITTRKKTSGAVTRSLAAAAVLTFFVAGPVDASCKKPLNDRPVIVQNYGTSIATLNRHEIERLPARPGYGRDGQASFFREITPMYGHTTIPIRDGAGPIWPRDKDFRRRLIEDELRRRGVIIDNQPNRPATQTENNAGHTTTKPKPKPKKPKVTKLPNGDTITEYPDGRREIKLKNGDTVTTYPNGRRVIRAFNGDTTETHPSGYRKTMTRYGTGRAVYPDGTTVDYTNSGKIILTRPDGTKFSRTKGTDFKPID